MDLLQLQYFRTIAKYENLTKASEYLFVTQPSLSVSISKLEDELGISLFDRRKGMIKLTQTGKVFLDYIERVLNELDTGIDHIHNIENMMSNRLRVAGNLVDLMGDVLIHFFTMFNGVSVKQVNCPNKLVATKVLNDEVDFAFVYGVPTNEGLEYIFLDSCERCLLLHTSHPLAQKTTVKMADLTGERFVCNQERDDELVLSEIFPRFGFRPNVIHICDSAQIEICLLRADNCISIAPLTHCLKMLSKPDNKDFIYIHINDQLPISQLGMIRRRGCLLSKTALSFYACVEKTLKENNVSFQKHLHN